MRPRQYDRQEVIEAATRLFWQRGYGNTSVSDLVEATGLNKRSMYQEFGNKAGLFDECVDFFVQRVCYRPFSILQREPLGMQNIADYFADRVAYACSPEATGCLLVNSANEGGGLDGAAMEKVQTYLAMLRDAFAACLRAGQEQGAISKEAECGAMANALMQFTAGMMVMSKAHPRREVLEASVGFMLQALQQT